MRVDLLAEKLAQEKPPHSQKYNNFYEKAWSTDNLPSNNNFQELEEELSSGKMWFGGAKPAAKDAEHILNLKD